MALVASRVPSRLGDESPSPVAEGGAESSPRPASGGREPAEPARPDSPPDTEDEEPPHGAGRPAPVPGLGWRASRPASPAPPPAPALLAEPSSRYANLSFWRARKVTFYKNGDPFFPGVEFRFRPGRDLSTMGALLDRLSARMELPRGARYVFSLDGDRKIRLEELEDGASYVVSSYKAFKVRITAKVSRPSSPPYPSITLGEGANSSSSDSVAGWVEVGRWGRRGSRGAAVQRWGGGPGHFYPHQRPEPEDFMIDSDEDSAFVVVSLSTMQPQAASYGKKNGVWYGAPSVGQGWGGRAPSRKTSVVEADLPVTGGTKPSAGRVIRIINNMDHTVQCRVLLNLRTTQPFEEVLEDLGQVLKMSGAKRMFAVNGQEVRSFSQLRNEFADVETFYLGVGTVGAVGPGAVTAGSVAGGGGESPMRRSRSRAAVAAVADEPPARARRARSKSRPRVLYAPESEIVRTSADYTLLEVLKEEPVRVTIRGLRRTFYPPIHHAPVDNSPPDKKLQLEWVYGYRGTDSRRNLWVLPTGELLYFVAAVAVMYDRDEETQRHYIGHTEDIQCMELHPSRELVASGQRAGRGRKTQAHIRIWSTETLQTLYVFGMGEFEVGVAAVAFSQLNGGSYVLAVDGGRESILSVWQWQWGHLLGKVATLQEEMAGAAFHPLDDNLLITHGKGHLAFWNRRKDGFFERTDIIKPPSRTNVTSLQFEQDGDVVTADSDGFITIYSVDSDGAYFVRMEFEAHNKGISSLIMLSEGTLLSGGEKDRKIAAWDSLQNYKRITDTKLPESAGGVRSIYPQRPGRNDGNIYVGTTRNNIMEGSLQRRFNQVVFGHGRQLPGLAVHPDDELFATAGQDKSVALWRRHRLVWSAQAGYECVSLAFHPLGAALAAGSSEGHLVVLAAETGAAAATVRVCGSPLSCVGYSPTGDMIAIGSQNGSVYLFRVTRDGFSYKKCNKIRGTQPLVQLDWSTDGCYLQTVTADYDIAFWDVKSLSPEKSPIAMKDVKWYTQFSTVGFLVAGMWNNRYYPMTSLITTASRSSAHDYLISGDADGHLRLFRYPCVTSKAEYTEQKVYSGQVSCARFLYNDRGVVSSGGGDAALMLWELVED